MSDQLDFRELRDVPNATAVLVLGIISIPGCFCYGIVGIITGIIALVLASGGQKAYALEPDVYKPASLKNLKAGRICAIIGLSLSVLNILSTIFYLIFLGSAAAVFPWEALEGL